MTQTAAPGHRPEALRAALRRNGLLGVKIVVSLTLLGYVLAHAGWAAIASTLRTAQPGWLAAGFAAGTAAALLQANQWRGLLSALGLRRSFWRCLQLDTAGRVFDAAMPTNIGGDVARAALVIDVPTDRAGAALSVLLRRLASLPGLVLLIAVGLSVAWHRPYADRIRPVALACILGGVALAAVLACLAGSRSLPVPVPRLVRKLAGAWTEARQRAAAAGDGGRPVQRAMLRGLAFWMVVVFSQWCFIKAVGVDAPLDYAAVVITTVNALSMLPISLGGYGLRESIFSTFLAVGGLAVPAQGVAVGVCLSAQTLVFGLVGGVAYVTVRRNRLDDDPPLTPAPAAAYSGGMQ